MAKLPWCVLLLVVIACQVHNAASEITFTPSPATGSVAEDAQTGATVTTLTSSDKDVTFTLVSQVPVTDPKIFAIDGTSGVVTVVDITNLDFEKGNRYTLVIKATQKTGSSPESANTTVVINVTDVNEAPKFAEDRYTACVNKSSPEGTVVLQVKATDEDDGDEFTYSITGSLIFEIETTTGTNGSTGTIKVATGQTIADSPTSYSLTITANDDDTTSLTGTTTVSINVTDTCPVVTLTPVVTPTPDVNPPTGVTKTSVATPAPNFATTIMASFGLFLISGAVHLLRIW